MVTFRNNRRGRFRGGDRNFKRNNGEPHKFKSDFSTNTNFQRKTPGRNNHNASKLITKYNDLAREALANGDKILSENYFQHADHFIRIIEEQEKNKPVKNLENSEKNELKKNNIEDDQDKAKQIINN
tara:strand:+ start:249 stop:629 length:381 start_codon:yes stop_codon:yes gene_type:complete